MHNWSSLVPFLGGLAFLAIAYVGKRSGHETWADQETYRYPPLLGYLLFGAAVFIVALALIEPRVIQSPAAVLWLAAAAMLAVALYTLRYRVTVSSSSLEFGAFNPVSIALSDIAGTDVVTGRRTALIVNLRDGRRLRFSGMLGDFSSLAATLARRVGAGSAAATGPNMQGVESQRKWNARRTNWTAAAGLVLFALLPLLLRLHPWDGDLSGAPAQLRAWICALPVLAQRLDCIDPGSADPQQARLASQALLAAQRLDLPRSDEVTALITSQQFTEFEQRSQRYERAFATDPAYESPLQKLYDAICTTDPQVAEQLDKWVHDRPSYMSYAARGIYGVNLGYRQRGEKYLAQTPAENLRRMDESFGRARADLTSALRLNPRFAPAYVALIMIAQAYGQHDEARRLEGRATREAPATYYVRHSYIMSLRPQWGGSYSAMRAYAASLDTAGKLNPRIWSLQGEQWAQRGMHAWQRGDERQALEYYSYALRYGDRLEFLEQRGFLYVNTRQYELALRDFSRYREYSSRNQRVNDYVQCIEDYRAGRGCHLKTPAGAAADAAQT